MICSPLQPLVNDLPWYKAQCKPKLTEMDEEAIPKHHLLLGLDTGTNATRGPHCSRNKASKVHLFEVHER